MSEIVPVVSEALEARVRDLLPSQRGFGQDLQASNVILPIIDLTSAAQGTTTPTILQTAQNYGGANVINVGGGATSTIINTAGFWQITGALNLTCDRTASVFVNITITDGVTPKIVYSFNKGSSTSFNEFFAANFEQIFFLRSGDSISMATSLGSGFVGSYRQIADVNGNLVYPTGFTPQ